jgi:hypothetical protein
MNDQPCIPGLDHVGTTAAGIFQLPKKPTCTPSEAARATGLSERQIRYCIEDGSLLAMSANRDPEAAMRPQWRVIVRLDRVVPAGKSGRTLSEFCAARMNV